MAYIGEIISFLGLIIFAVIVIGGIILVFTLNIWHVKQNSRFARNLLPNLIHLAELSLVIVFIGVLLRYLGS